MQDQNVTLQSDKLSLENMLAQTETKKIATATRYT